jgi:hypothetical protein
MEVLSGMGKNRTTGAPACQYDMMHFSARLHSNPIAGYAQAR